MHPKWDRSCKNCMAWLHDDAGKVCMRAGQPQPFPKGGRLPCSECPKIPQGEAPRPENAIELSDRNWQAYQHYLECRAVGQFPDDPIVRRNAKILRAIQDEHDKVPMHKLIAMIGLMGVRNG